MKRTYTREFVKPSGTWKKIRTPEHEAVVRTLKHFCWGYRLVKGFTGDWYEGLKVNLRINIRILVHYWINRKKG